MPIRVTHNVLVQISSDTAGKQKLVWPETNAVTSDGFDQQVTSNLQVAASASQALTFGDVAAVRGFYLEVNQDCLLTINGGTPIQLRKHPGATTAAGRARFFIEAEITSVSVDNSANAEALVGQYTAWGDPTP